MIPSDPIHLKPEFEGKHGRAWPVKWETSFARYPADASIGMWLVEAPWAHPVWHSYILNVIHLRMRHPEDMPPKFYLAGATHEIWLQAMEAKGSREMLIKQQKPQSAWPRLLRPLNFAGQFIAPSDAAARARAEKDIQAIVAGDLSPDTDFRSLWIARYGDHMMKETFKRKPQ